MPVPKPGEKEKQDEFIGRCMSNETMQSEYPEQEQRLAICFNSWRDVHGGKKPEEALMLFGKLEEAVKLPNGKFKVHGIAIHPMATIHPSDWTEKRVYFEDELIKAASSLAGKPILLDHKTPLSNCVLTLGKWDAEASGVYYEGEVTEEVAGMIKGNVIKGVSISINPWRKGGGVEFVNGIAPYGFEFDELSFLKDLEPGDPQAWVKLCETISQVQKIIGGKEKMEKEELKQLLKEVVREELKTFKAQEMNVEEIKAKITGLAKRRAEIAEKLYPEAELTTEERATLQAEQEVIWSEISALEKALAIVITGEVAEKLPEGYIIKMVLKEQEEKKCTEFTTEETCKAAGFHWYDNTCHKEPKLPENAELVEARKESVDLKAKITDLEKQLNEADEARKAIKVKVGAIIPPKQIVFSYGQTGGFKRLVEALQKVYNEI